MSENEIKPVAWCAPDSLNAAKFGGLAMITSNNKHGCSEPLYDQSAIDRLTAERDAAVADAASLRERMLALEAQRDDFGSREWQAEKAKRQAEAERDAVVADAERYRWLRSGSGVTWDQPWVAVGHCDVEWSRQPNEIEGKQLDDAIDAARAEGGV